MMDTDIQKAVQESSVYSPSKEFLGKVFQEVLRTQKEILIPF